MSPANVEIVRSMVERWNAGERGLDVVAEYCDPTIEFESPFSSVVGEPYRGHAGVEQWTRDIDEQFAEWRLSLDDVREIGDAVIAIGGVHGRGRASGVVFEFPSASVAYFGTDRRITRLRIYLDVSEALEAVGLEQ
ncbi:MAG TPA: nuclear transport factor 2 family protein [Solirubrobacteraceae bacterium]|nr:nuclear transport factor 2 family protein [Solirubrobacteraceae bacterium]